MRFVIQRVTDSSVVIDGETVGKIDRGYLVLIGVSDSDTEAVAEDENGKTNLSLADVEGSLLLVSQFTLYANCRKGNRPSFIEAGSPDRAEALYEYIIAECRKSVPDVQTGRFGAEMKVSLVNDGPFTILLDSETL